MLILIFTQCCAHPTLSAAREHSHVCDVYSFPETSKLHRVPLPLMLRPKHNGYYHSSGSNIKNLLLFP